MKGMSDFLEERNLSTKMKVTVRLLLKFQILAVICAYRFSCQSTHNFRVVGIWEGLD